MGCGVVDAVGEAGSENFGAGSNDPGSLTPCFLHGATHPQQKGDKRPPRRLRKVVATVSECLVGPETNDYKQDDLKQQKLS